MAIWRERILGQFDAGVARIIVAVDPHGILGEELLQQELRERGLELFATGDDPIAFRYLYEVRHRQPWDSGEPAPQLIVHVRGGVAEARALPYDVLAAGRLLELSLHELFPGLDADVIAQLDPGDLDRLEDAIGVHRPSRLSDAATRDFVLRHVFGIVPEAAMNEHQLLRALLAHHFPARRLPPLLTQRWLQLLRQQGRFPGWPLEEILPDRDAFLQFLQERWPVFVQDWLDRHLHDLPSAERPAVREAVRPRWPKGQVLPFGHPDVRVYMDNLFVEGVLRPVGVSHPDVITRFPEVRDSWMALGLRLEPRVVRAHRLERLFAHATERLPSTDARYPDWQVFAGVWAELVLVLHQDGVMGPENRGRFEVLCDHLDRRFLRWLDVRYAGLHSVPGSAPAMLHQVPRTLARELESTRSARVALLVIDGLALDQWLVLRDEIEDVLDAFDVEERTVFSWVPTVTPVARQALFAGRPPVFFAESISRTDRDAGRWRQYWTSRGLPPEQVRHVAGIRDTEDLVRVEAAAIDPQVRVLGLVADTVDRTLHGITLGTGGLHAAVRHWARTGFLSSLLELLATAGFTVYLTSDHGNVESRGIGRPAEGVLAESRGERVRIYGSAVLRDGARALFPDAIAWDSTGLPEGYLPLLAPAREAFVPAGERIVAHGGASLEEVVVPLVRISKQPE